MPDLDLTDISAARAEVGSLRDQLRVARLSLTQAATRRDDAMARGNTAAADAAAAEADSLGESLRSGLSGIRDASAEVRRLSDALLSASSPEDAVSSLTGRHPVLLLPVRVETRFFDNAQTLKVRIFPDQVHVTAHDPALTADEVDGLTWYWTHRWLAPDAETDEGRALAEEAWQGLTARFSPGRAAFVVRTYPPENLGTGDAMPTWGEVPLRSGEWSTAARAGLLPDRWCVLGFRSTGEAKHTEIFRAWGSAVPDSLSAGPTPDPEAPTEPGGMPTDPDLLWLHDVAEAERLGMLVTVQQADLAAGMLLADGVDRLVVLGVDWTQDPEQAASAVETHLAAHADEGRLAFVPQGAPTNSTGRTRSGFSTDIAVAQKVLAPHSAPSPHEDAAGRLTAAVLGVPATRLSAVAGADLREQAWQGSLLDATWSATGGYYLTEMLDPAAVDPAIESSMRHHVAANLRASGPMPTLRVGAQPYGLLPVVPRGRFEPDVRRRAQDDVQRVTSALRELVEPLVSSVPRLAQVRRREDVDDVILALLLRTPVPWSFTFRKLIGPVERRAVSINWDLKAAFQRDVTAALLSALECFDSIRLTELTHDDLDHPLNVPLVLKPEPTPADPQQQGTGYLGEMRALLTEPNGVDILDARKDSVALLEAFIACAAVNENRKVGKRVVADAASQLELSEQFTSYVARVADRVPYTLRVEPVSAAPAVAGSSVTVPTTPREFGQTVIPALTGEQTISQHVAIAFRDRITLPGLLDSPEDPMHRLERMRTALESLQQAPADQLEWAFRGVLDLYSTRLDAWITSLATARLSEHREADGAGLHVGGWCVVEDLHPDGGPGAESLGFVHVPSLAQSASVAVLRAARESHRDAQGRVFDLDLTSRRVRQALRILEGVGSGQRLAALLGYRVERGLQERDLLLAQWILPLRQQCPLRSARPDSPEVVEPVEVVAARDVVDGLALLDRWEADRNGLLAAAGIPAGAARDGVAAVIDDVAGLADAVSDVLLSEAVHQATTGNLERSGAALAAHDRQDPPPDPEFVRTPRAGAVVTHRVGVWLPRDVTEPAEGWPTDLRSLAEPRLDHWLGSVLGDPSRWTVGARLVSAPAAGPDGDVPAGAQPTFTDLPDIDLAALGLSPLSVVLAARRPGSGQPNELESRLAAHYARTPEVLGAATTDDRLELAAAGLAGLTDLAAWAAEVVGAAPLAPEHLSSSTDVRAGVAGPAATVEVDEAVTRATAVAVGVETAVTATEEALAAYVASPDAGAEAALLDDLLRLVEVEGPEALPSGRESSLAEHTTALVARVRARLAAAAAVPAPHHRSSSPGTSLLLAWPRTRPSSRRGRWCVCCSATANPSCRCCVPPTRSPLRPLCPDAIGCWPVTATQSSPGCTEARWCDLSSMPWLPCWSMPKPTAWMSQTSWNSFRLPTRPISRGSRCPTGTRDRRPTEPSASSCTPCLPWSLRPEGPAS
ncbi:MAG: hypothetical protein H0U35_09215 [Sporichthyaceae bacterium]|nr:hypothetical protein [Sporichthyaceae bacterium]